jgi:benzoate membrane transport protein
MTAEQPKRGVDNKCYNVLTLQPAQPTAEGALSMHWSDTIRSWLPTFGTAIPNIIIPIAVLSIPLAAAQEMRLSEAETTSWILAVYGLPGLLGLVLAIRYRQPLLFTGNVFVLIFIASLGSQLSYPELVGASIGAGAGVLLIGALGLTD